MAIKFAFTCPEPEFPVNVRGIPACSNGGEFYFTPIMSGLGDLDWNDVSLLIGALLLSATIATGWNILAKMFYRG